MSTSLYQGLAYTQMFLMVASSDHITGLTGASPTVNLSKAGGAFSTAAGTVTEVSSGWYKVALTTADTNTVGSLAYHITAASADATDFTDTVVPLNTIKKNTALPAFQFIMTTGATFTPVTGLTGASAVTAQRSIDGAGFATCTNPVTEISNGWYQLNLSAADMNGTVIALRFSNTQASDQDITIITSP